MFWKWGEILGSAPSVRKQKTFETPPKIGMQTSGSTGKTHSRTIPVQTPPLSAPKAKSHIGAIVLVIAIAILIPFIYLTKFASAPSEHIDILPDSITVAVGSPVSVPFSSSFSDIELTFDRDCLSVQSDSTGLYITGLREGTATLKIHPHSNKSASDSMTVIVMANPLSKGNPYYALFNPAKEFILPHSNSHYYDKADLQTLSKEQLIIARNEIFARHGYIFQTEAIAEYFNACSWYDGTIQGSKFRYDVFNDYENSNVALIIAYEQELGYRS